jgi:hypothetical protein
MTYLYGQNSLFLVRDRIDDAITTLGNPVLVLSGQFLTAGGSWVI